LGIGEWRIGNGTIYSKIDALTQTEERKGWERTQFLEISV
jgi:hypothetical protein